MDGKNSQIKYASPLVIEFIRYSGLCLSKIMWRISYSGVENIPQKLPNGLVVVANHQSYFDPFWISLKIRRKFRFMAWDEACNWFLIGRAIRYLGAFPVSLKRGGTRKAMIEALRSLKDGATLIIFPEGSRGFSDGKLLEFKAGAVRLAMESKVPIMPVTIRGGNKVWAQDIKFPHFSKVEIYYHPIIETASISEANDERESAENLTLRIKEIIESKM